MERYRKGGVIYSNPNVGVEVFEATEIAPPNTPVVIKVITSVDVLVLNCVLEEAFTQHSLNHDSICRILHVGLASNRVGQPANSVFIVLEKMHGDLAKHIKDRAVSQTPFSEAEVWHFLRQLVAALAFAQEKVRSR